MHGLHNRRIRHDSHPPRDRRPHAQPRLFSKQRRLLFVMSIVCLLSLIHEDFLSFIKSKSSYPYTTTDPSVNQLLFNETRAAKNETVHANAVKTNVTYSNGNNKETTLLLDDDDEMSSFALEPMWNCTNQGNFSHESSSFPTRTAGRRKKLLFVHVFKTAGSTMRSFFVGYGRACSHTGVSIVSQCSGLNVAPPARDGIDDESVWTNHGGGGECVLQTFQPRHGDPAWMHTSDNEEKTPQEHQQQQWLLEKPRLARSFLRATTDVLIGHFPLGVHEHWLVNNNSSINNSINVSTTRNEEYFSYQYVVFFRDPLNKLVSGYLYSNRMRHNLTTEQAANELYDRVWEKQNVQKLYHDGYSSYLLTPIQKREIGRLYKGGIKNTTAATIKHNMAIIKSNLLGMRVMVGIVEQMTSSLAILRHLIDGRGELNAAWKALDTTTTSAAADAAKHPTTLHHHSTMSEPSSIMSDEQLQQTKQNPFALNKSRLSTTKIARLLLERDHALLSEHLRYEQDLYNFAMQIHQRQYHATIVGTSKS
jgi:hypothetical protein